MNEEAIKDSYQLFVNNGYSKSVEEFKVLMRENENARKDMFDLFVSEGYKKTPEDFNLLMGVGQVKKKEDSEPTARWEDLALPTEQVEEGPISLEYSQQKNLDAQEPVAPLLEDKADPSSPDFKFDVQEVQEVSELNEKPSVQIEDKIEDTERTIGINKAKDLIVSPITEDEAQTEQDRINSISIKNKFPESANDPVVLRNSEDQFERGIGRINDLFSQTEAKAAADLRKAFDQYGFKFEEAVGGVDAIKVTSANGKEITVRRKVGNKGAKVTELKDFLNENRVASTVVQNRINTSLGKDTKKEKRALTEEDLEEESKIYTNQFDSYQKNVSDYDKRKKALSNSTPTNEQELAVYNKEVGNLNALSVSLNKEQENLISSQGELEKLAGDYAYYESQKWDVPSLMIQSIANGLLSASVGVGSFIADAVDVADLSWITGDDDKENDAVYKAFKDKLREGRDMILEDLQILGTTTKAIEKVKKDSFVAGALIGTLESVPAMVSGIGGLFAHSYAGADDALRQYKGYEDIGDLEAFTLKVGLSAAGAYLEKAGLDNAMGKTGLLNRFLLQTLKTIPKDASEIVVHQTLKRKAIDFVKGLGSATVGEGATGGAQEAVDIGIKAAYNEMKGINVFKTPETIGQFFEQVVEASAAEAIGGLALGGAGAVATALSNEKVMDLPDGVIEMFEMMSSSNKFDPLFSKSLKVQLAKGEITKEEAQEQLDNYREAKSSMKQIPKDYTTPQKKMAMSLLGIKKRLEKTIEAGDPDLVKDLKKQLDNVKEKLSTVKQDVTNMKEGVEITDPNETYFFDFKSKKEIPDALKGLKPVAETISKRSKLGKTQNIRLGFTGTQLLESGFAVIDNEIKLLEENRSRELKEIDDKKFDDTLKLVTDENGKTYRNTKARQKKAEQDRINKVYDDKIAKFNIEKEKATKESVISQEVQVAEVDETTEVKEEVVVETTPATEAEETVGQVVNRPVMLTEYGGKVFDEPIKGSLLIEDQRVSFEAEDGKIYDIGNKNDLENKRIDEVGIKYEAQNVKASKDGALEVGGNEYTIQKNLPTVGVEYNTDGDVTAVSVKDESGKPVMFKGTIAEEMAYQILLNEAESEAQKNKINEILEKDEEFKNELRQAEESSKKEADTNTEEAVRKTVGNQEAKVESEPEKKEEVAPSEKSVDEQVDVLTNILEGKTPVEETKALPRKQIDNQVDNAKKALSKVAPEVEIIVSESEDEYKKATKEGRNQNTGGRYIDGKIYINPNRANKRTVAHEVFHALLLSKGRTDQQAQAITERMMEAVKKNADQELLDRLEKFSSNYKKALESEESIAELIGILADGYPQLNAEAKSLIKRWLDRLAKIFGLKPLTSDTDIINFLNTVSDKIASGKNIKSRDVKVLGDVQGKSESQSRQQNADKPSITEVRRIAKENGLKEEAVDKVLKNLGYTSAEISESIEIENEIERQSKKSIKRPISAKKIIGKSKRDKVTVDEMSSLKTQIRLEAKVAKGAKTDLNQKRKNLAKIIKDFEKGKNITTAKSQTIINKISKVNLDNEAAVEKLLDYIAKQYGIAKAKEETSTSNTKRERALKNIKSKIGTAKDTFNIFKNLFSYDSGLITNEKLKKQYEDLLNRFGSSSAVLSVKDLKSEAKIAREIVEVMEKENAQFEDLADVFYENQVLDKDGSIDYKATMDILGKGTNPILVKDQLDVLEKYNKKLDLKKTKESLTPEQQQEEIDSLIDSAMKEKVTNKVTDNKYSRISAFKFIELMKDRKNLEGLTENQLKSLPLILENINNGIFTTRANTIMNALDVKGNSDAVTAQLNKAKALAIESIMRGLQTKVMFMSKKTSAYRQMESNALKDIDTILGLKGKEIYNRTFKRMGSAFATFQEATREVNEKLTDINTKLYKKFTEENKVVEAKYRIQAYMLELEYESNPEMAKKGGVFKASEWIDETIKTLEDKGNQKNTIKILREVKKQVEGKSAEEIKSGMTRVEKEAVNVINKINEETAEKALYVGSVVRGSRPEMINEYVHHDVMSSDKGRKAENAEIADHYDKTTNVKTKAGTVEGRTKGVKALNMDALNSTLRGAKQTLLDFHITNENRVVKKILSTVKENVNAKSENTRENKVLKLAEISPREFAVAMNESYDETMAIAFGSSFRAEGYLDKVISFGYQYKLAGVPRAFAEFSSNLGYAAIADPVSFGLGAKFIFQKNGLSDSIEFLTLSGSSELSRFTGAKNTGKSVDMLAKNVDLSKAEGRSALSNAVKTFSNKSGVKFVSGGAEVIADVLISTPDKAVSLPIWVGTFTSEMKKSNIDLEQFKNNADYRSEKAKEIEAARNKADQSLNKAAGTQSLFGGVLKNKINKRDDGGLVQAHKYINGYLTNFLIFEYSTARDGIIGMMGNGEISRLKGAQLLTAATVRMASYGLLYKVFSSLIYGAFGAEDEDEDEIGVNEVTRAFIGAAASLFLGRNFGTIARRGLNIGVEYLNEEYGQSIRGDKEYDSFKHGLGLGYFNIKSDDLKDKDKMAYQFIKEASGPLSSHAVLGLNMMSAGAKIWNPKNDKEKEESIDYLLSQALIETAGLFTGKIPLIKDLKKYLFTIPTSNEFALKDKQYSYNELKDKNKIKFATEEEKFQSKPEIKKIDIDLNKVTRLIKGGTLSEENEIKAKQKQSTLKDDKKALKREYMDEQFGFKDKKDIGKVSKNDNVNDKSIDEQMAEMEIIDERTYKEYKEENERKYNKTLRKYKSNRTYRKSEDQKSKLTRKLKDAQRKKRDNLIPELKAKIKLIQQEMKGNKREFFSKAFKK
jgi:hypothetical protein